MVEVVDFKRPDAVSVISALEDLLAQARAGAVSGLAFAVTRPDGDVETDVCWEAGRAAPLLLAGVVLLERSMVDVLLAANDET